MIKLQRFAQLSDIMHKKPNILTGGGGAKYTNKSGRLLEARNQKQNTRNEFQASTLVPKASVVPSQNFCASTKISWSSLGKKKQSLASGFLSLASRRQKQEEVATKNITAFADQISEEATTQNAPQLPPSAARLR